jgi:exodeoxyribonuclease-3
MKIITWNINSIRLRIGLVMDLLAEQQPDILCLQETKCPDEHFPHDAFNDSGYTHRAIRGEKGYNGVAIIAKKPLHNISYLNWAGKKDCRHIAASTENGLTIHNLYIPAGGDVPDPQENDKFAHKLMFLDELKSWSRDSRGDDAVLVGDLNVAPREDDVWSHKQLLKVVSHTPIECEKLNDVIAAGNWQDVVRDMIPEGKLYSWWSYRARDWDAADKGRRLDHIWMTPNVAPRVKAATVLRHVRGWEKPSDHAPVVVEWE